jgi:hypothetical protein
MARFEKFDSTKQLQGLAEAARQIQIEQLIRDGKMPSFDQVVAAIDETRQKYRPHPRGPAEKVIRMIMSIQDFICEVVTPAIQRLSPEQKAEFRQALLSQVAAKQKESDRRFLCGVGIDPDGD